MAQVFRLGSRGSVLALRQAEYVASMLTSSESGVRVQVVPFQSIGDEGAYPAAGSAPGVFTRTLDQQLLEEEVDLVVHSLKDLPVRNLPGTTISAILKRDDPADVLCSQSGRRLSALPAGCRVGTGSPRRYALLHEARPDLEVVMLRGNIDTRLRRLHEPGHCEAVVLAAAGLQRLGRSAEITERFDPIHWLPAPGQGALAIMVREGDEETQALTAPLNDPKTNVSVSLERHFLAALGGGCSLPVGAYARVEDHSLVFSALLADPEEGRIYRSEVRGPASTAAAFIDSLLKDIYDQAGRVIPENACQHS